jgi:coproporphyrinogen III oxidase
MADAAAAPDATTLDERRAAAKAWFESLRDKITARFEALEDAADPALYPGEPGRFELTAWDRGEAGEDLGGGVMGLMHGRLFEKVGVHVSTVHGDFSPEFAKRVARGLARSATAARHAAKRRWTTRQARLALACARGRV